MRNLYKKIGAIALAGMMVFGWVSSGKLNIYADNQPKVSNNKFSKDDLKKYKDLVYGVQLPKSDYARYNSLSGLLNNDKDKRVKKQMKDIEDVCANNENIFVLQLSSEVDKEGANSVKLKKRGINAYLHGLRNAVGKNIKGNPDFFKEAQLFFDDIYDFKIYLEEESDKFESGLVRLQIGNVEGVFMIRNGKVESGNKH